VARAALILHWQENLTEKEMPPKWMWGLDEDLNRHFERLNEERGGSSRDDEDDEPSGPMVKNEYARSRGRGAR
jgi:hypothetical protein